MDLTKKEYFEEEITLAEFAERFLGHNDFQTPVEIDVKDLDVEILGYDLKTNQNEWKKINTFVVKPSVDVYYSDGNLKGTSVHRIIENGKEIYLCDHVDFKKINEPMHVVDLSVDEIENYFANGRLNHNTTTSGKALPFAASLRIKLLGKSPVVIPDPFVEQEWEKMLKQYEFEVKEWQEKGKLGSKPEKPKKPKGDEVIIGYQVTARTEKNKIGPPKREAEFTIIFSQGIMEEDAWLDYGVKYNVIKQISSTEFEFINHPEVGKFKRKEFKGILADVELHDEIKKELVSKLVRAPLASEINDEEEEEELTEN